MKNSLVIYLFLLLMACQSNEKPKKLPIVGEFDIETKIIDGKKVEDTIFHVVPTFDYINQDSIRIYSKDLKSKVWITDFFFTNCPTICPPMTTNMKRLNAMLADVGEHLHFLSFSIDPESDTPHRLREYIKEHGIKANNWYFFTGNEEETHELARHFFNGAEKNDEVPGGFGHTPYFSLVDKNGHIRGIYDGTDSDAVDSMARDVRLLLKTEYNVVGKKN